MATNEHKLTAPITPMRRVFLWFSHGSMARRGSLPYTGSWLQRLRSHHGFTLAKQRGRVSAFTLAELLIATGVTAGLVVMLGWMLGALMGTASHANARVDAFRDARAAMQMMERDLRNIVPNQWSPDPFANTTPCPTPTPTPTATPLCTFPATTTSLPMTLPAAYFSLRNIYPDPATAGNQNQQLYALIADKTSGSPGDVCAVGYYCRWDDQLRAYTLRRFFRDSAATFPVMQAAGSYAADSALYVPSVNDEVLAAYVWNFHVTLYDTCGNPLSCYPYVCDPSGANPRPRPAAIEISFNAMSPQAARTVMSVTANNATAYNVWMAGVNPNPSPSDLQLYQRLIVPHMYQFRSRINLP